MDVTTIKKIQVNGENYFLKVIWNDDWKLDLFSRDQYWSGVLTCDKIGSFCNQLNLNQKQYVENAKKALSTDDPSNDFIINFSNGKLVWEKNIPLSTLTMKHGVVEMEHFIDGGSEVLVNELLGLMKTKDDLLENKDQELKNVAQQLKDLIEKFENSAKLKVKMEEDLYFKFITLLNEKKMKISEYEEFIKNLESKGSIFTSE